MKGAAKIEAEKEAGDWDEKEEHRDKKRRKELDETEGDDDNDQMEVVRHRTVGEVEVQVFRSILPQAAID